MTNLPPLNSLRAFDAAARRLTFTSAAEHLHVTHGAVSRQVQQLETFLGQRLFDRLPKGLELTAAGRQLAFTTGRMFEDLGQIVSELRADSRLNIITVSTVASLAARWLVPRRQDRVLELGICPARGMLWPRDSSARLAQVSHSSHFP